MSLSHLIEDTVKVNDALLEWYELNRRILPWRNIASLEDESEENRLQRVAYRVWVSEIMCQQTKIVVVIEYFERWMKELPNLKSLAESSEEQITSLWAGLGYYSRGRNLRKAAQMLMSEYNGQIPNTINELKKLPGIGDYTAGAIASIVFKKQVPLVDGNVIRVFSRLNAVSLPRDNPKLKKFCWELGEKLVPANNPGEWNQGLMELGATVCTPKTPSCNICPLSSFCLASKGDLPTSVQSVKRLPSDISKMYPLPKKPKVSPVEIYKVLILYIKVDDNIKFLLRRRPKKGLLANQLEFLMCLCKNEDSNTPTKILPSFKKALTNLNIDISLIQKPISAGKYTHVFSHIKHKMSFFVAKAKVEEGDSKPEHLWLTRDEMLDLGISSGTRTALNRALEVI